MKTATLGVAGMTCGGCVSTVTKALKAVDGVSDVAVWLEKGEARIQYDELTTSLAQLREAIERAGYRVEVAGGQRKAGGGCCG